MLLRVLPRKSLQPGTAWAQLGLIMHEMGCLFRDVPMQAWCAHARVGRVNRECDTAALEVPP